MIAAEFVGLVAGLLTIVSIAGAGLFALTAWIKRRWKNRRYDITKSYY